MHIDRLNLAVVAALWCLAGCAADGASFGDEGALTKGEARRMGGKADDGVDWCLRSDWYGDGVCDDFCPQPDVTDCPETRSCGGHLDLTCQGGEYCYFEPEVACGAGDELGSCRARAASCAELYMPVCGCDGRTYANPCEAGAAGTSVARDGECGAVPCESDADCPDLPCESGDPCPEARCLEGACVAAEVPGDACGASCSEDDCRADGCNEGESCSYCWGAWACVPAGSRC